jgi:hypothetical protein
MTRSVASALLLIGVLVTSGLGFSESPGNVKTIRGRIVAYSNVKWCSDGNAQWDVIIAIQDSPRRSAPEFIRVFFSLPCDQAPEWPRSEASSLQDFRLIRDRKFDGILREFMDCSHEVPPTTCQVPNWKRVPGSEHEELPFGRLLPSYRSVEVPVNHRG